MKIKDKAELIESIISHMTENEDTFVQVAELIYDIPVTISLKNDMEVQLHDDQPDWISNRNFVNRHLVWENQIIHETYADYQRVVMEIERTGVYPDGYSPHQSSEGYVSAGDLLAAFRNDELS